MRLRRWIRNTMFFVWKYFEIQRKYFKTLARRGSHETKRTINDDVTEAEADRSVIRSSRNLAVPDVSISPLQNYHSDQRDANTILAFSACKYRYKLGTAVMKKIYYSSSMNRGTSWVLKQPAEADEKWSPTPTKSGQSMQSRKSLSS